MRDRFLLFLLGVTRRCLSPSLWSVASSNLAQIRAGVRPVGHNQPKCHQARTQSQPGRGRENIRRSSSLVNVSRFANLDQVKKFARHKRNLRVGLDVRTFAVRPASPGDADATRLYPLRPFFLPEKLGQIYFLGVRPCLEPVRLHAILLPPSMVSSQQGHIPGFAGP